MEKEHSRIPASVGILTLNNSKELQKTLPSLSRFEDVYLCDGNSTDGTQEIALSYGARVTKQVDTDTPNQRITNFGETRTRCLTQGKYDWHVRVDSDEYLSPEAVEEIAAIVKNPNPPHLVYKIPRHYVWQGKVIDDTITYPNRQIRFFNRKAVPRFTKITHEKAFVNPGYSIGILKSPMYVPLPDSYASLDASRTKRALDWDRRHYEASMNLSGLVISIIHTGALLMLYSLRLFRVRLISRGNKLPFAIEFWRFKYQILTIVLATRIVLGKIFSRQQ